MWGGKDQQKYSENDSALDFSEKALLWDCFIHQLLKKSLMDNKLFNGLQQCLKFLSFFPKLKKLNLIKLILTFNLSVCVCVYIYIYIYIYLSREDSFARPSMDNEGLVLKKKKNKKQKNKQTKKTTHEHFNLNMFRT